MTKAVDVQLFYLRGAGRWSLSRAARALIDDWPRGGACMWPSKHDLDDPKFHWCGWPTLPGKAYCPQHYRRSIDRDRTNHGEEVHESIERAGLGDDTLRPFTGSRVVLARGRGLGDKRQWKVVRVKGGSAPARRSPIASTAAAATARHPT